MVRRILLLATPLAVLAVFEALFALGAWEPVAAPMSHSGTTIAMKREWEAHSAPVDVVTLGSSRAVYGLDHRRLADAAHADGLAHASFAMAGSHWMTVRSVSRWLERRRPEVSRRLIALSVLDFQFAGNGPYELAIVEPVRSRADAAWLTDHVAFSRADVATYGIYSSLFQYREDVQSLARGAGFRVRELSWSRSSRPPMLFDGPRETDDICATDTSRLAACARPTRDGAPVAERRVAEQCRGLLPAARPVQPAASAAPLAMDGSARAVILAELGQARWRGRTTVLLLPTHGVWLREIAPAGLRERVLAELAPLVAAGTIELLDYTDFLGAGPARECDGYWDLYHQNARSATALTEAVVADLRRGLYRRGERASAGSR